MWCSACWCCTCLCLCCWCWLYPGCVSCAPCCRRSWSCPLGEWYLVDCHCWQVSHLLHFTLVIGTHHRVGLLLGLVCSTSCCLPVLLLYSAPSVIFILKDLEFILFRFGLYCPQWFVLLLLLELLLLFLEKSMIFIILNCLNSSIINLRLNL